MVSVGGKEEETFGCPESTFQQTDASLNCAVLSC